jgi:hypothetical protein
MNEARRFIRYVIPGILFAIQLTIVLWMLRQDLVADYLRALNEDNGIGLVLAGVLVSGGLGVMFSAIHHSLHWRPRETVLHYGKFLEVLGEREILTLDGQPPKNLSRKEAWALVTRLWHERVETSDKIKGADPRIEGLIDMAHSTGTMRVAGFAAAGVAFGWAAFNSKLQLDLWPIVGFVSAGAFALAGCYLFQRNYIRVAGFAKVIIEGVLYDALSDEAATKKGPVDARRVEFK